MTSAEMLTVLKTKLDSGFWTDTELYQALSNGQREVLTFLASSGKYSKDYITRVTKNFTSDSEPVTESRPIVSARYSYGGTNYYACRIYSVAEAVGVKDNSLLSPDEYDPVLYQNATEATLLPSPVGNQSKIEYTRLKDIGDIDSSTQPKLDERTHNAIVQWAYAEVLSKDESRAAEGEAEKKIFYQILRAV